MAAARWAPGLQTGCNSCGASRPELCGLREVSRDPCKSHGRDRDVAVAQAGPMSCRLLKRPGVRRVLAAGRPPRRLGGAGLSPGRWGASG